MKLIKSSNTKNKTQNTQNPPSLYPRRKGYAGKRRRRRQPSIKHASMEHGVPMGRCANVRVINRLELSQNYSRLAKQRLRGTLWSSTTTAAAISSTAADCLPNQHSREPLQTAAHAPSRKKSRPGETRDRYSHVGESRDSEKSALRRVNRISISIASDTTTSQQGMR